MSNKVKELSDMDLMTARLNPGIFFSLPEFKTEVEMRGIKSTAIFKIQSSGDHLRGICDREELDPADFIDFIQLCEIVAFEDILEAVKHRMEKVRENLELI